MRGKINFGVNEITDIRDLKTTNYSLSYQNKETIDKFNKSIDNRNDIGSAELLYRLSLLEYKRQFVTFCLKNHYEICMDSIQKRKEEERRYHEWLNNQPTVEMELGLNEPTCYEDATMRYSKRE